MNLISLSRVRFAYPDKPVLEDVDLSLRPGDNLCLLGENGAGKSTLLRLCAGILAPASGEVLLDGRPLSGLAHAARARARAYLPQESAPVFSFSAMEVVLMGRYAHKSGLFEGDADLKAAEEAMAQTDCLRLAERPFNRLSGGERRRVLLAQALAQEAPLMLLDEPTTGLDPGHALALLGLLSDIVRSGKALLWSTHDLNLAARFAGKAALLSSGRVVLEGAVGEVLAQAGPYLGVPLHLGRLPSGAAFAVPA